MPGIRLKFIYDSAEVLKKFQEFEKQNNGPQGHDEPEKEGQDGEGDEKAGHINIP